MAQYDPTNTFGYSAYGWTSRPSYDQSPPPHSPTCDSTPSTISSATCLTTPPSTLRQYSSALKAMMAQGMDAAVADMNDDTREAERSFDKEFGYDDEDPIERHVKLNLTPCRIKAAQIEAKARRITYHEIMDAARAREEQERGQMEELLVQTPIEEGKALDDAVDDPKHFRPGLIHFHRTHSSSRRGIPSFGSSQESLPNSGASTPFEDTGTPGSEFSEASFEAIKPEDVRSLYGKANLDHGYPFPMSVPSDTTFGHIVPNKIDRSSMISNSSTITSLSTISSLSTATIAEATRQARPTLFRPRPRTNPYAGSYEGRQREKEALPSIGHLKVDEEEWDGRTVSEQMVFQAGMRCQRGRNVGR